GVAGRFLAAWAPADLPLDVVAVRATTDGGFRRLSPAEVGALLAVAGPHRSVSPQELLLGRLPGGTVLVRPHDDGATLQWSLVGGDLRGREPAPPVTPDPAALAAAIAAHRPW
ncbi:MAG: hypothetical protein ACK4V6_07215, partial [Microthrixaceae bacterium]